MSAGQPSPESSASVDLYALAWHETPGALACHVLVSPDYITPDMVAVGRTVAGIGTEMDCSVSTTIHNNHFWGSLTIHPPVPVEQAYGFADVIAREHGIGKVRLLGITGVGTELLEVRQVRPQTLEDVILAERRNSCATTVL